MIATSNILLRQHIREGEDEMKKVFSLVAAMTVALSTNPAIAEGPKLGETEYANSCAQCHGADGKGGGSLAGYLTQSLPDLTQLQKNNGGVFPVMALYEMIDGRGTMGPHGSREMPAWGNRYNADAEDLLALDYSPIAREEYIRAHILALIEHIASMQEQ